MQILILGASSQIGRQLAFRFSPKNTVTLVGRSREELQLVGSQCEVTGAQEVKVVLSDLSEGCDLLLQKIGDQQFDMIINLVSATSRIKDSEFIPRDLQKYLMSDLLVPVQLISAIIEKSKKPLGVIFVSSVLAEVKSPDRAIYSSLKLLQEVCLSRLLATGLIGKLLVVKVGKVIPHERGSQVAEKLADKIFESYQRNKRTLDYGWSGRVLLFLFYMQPIIFSGIVKLQRLLRRKFS